MNIRAFLLLFLLLILQDLPEKTPAQLQRTTDFVYKMCAAEKYDANSMFAQNLNAAIGILKQKATAGEKYHLTSVSEGSISAYWVFITYQCRGDLSVEDCSDCISFIFADGYSCQNAIGMRVQLLGCYFRYESYDFTDTVEFTFDVVRSNCSTKQNDSSIYQSEIAAALNRSVDSAASDGGYAAISVGSAYALAQCLGYLTPIQCSTCLSRTYTRSTICSNSSSGFFHYVSCYFLFSDTPFTFLPSTSDSSPSFTLPSSVSSPSRPPTLSALAIAVISIGSLFGIAFVAVFYFACVFKRRRRYSAFSESIEDAGSEIKYKFTVQELQAASEGFHSRNIVGQGGFGVVYKGKLRNGEEVAIKVITPGENRVKAVDFMNEAKLISTVQHRNLIHLIGCAMDDSSWYLVCEYLPHRSLDLHLFAAGNDADKARAVLDWETRFNIIVGIARGLCYLHEESQVRIVHRDIKVSNILLDGNLEPKIADFGLARLFPADASHLTTAVAGTLGYVAPEYASRGQLSEKADVYSFGLVTLEIVSGRKVIDCDVTDPEEIHLLEWAWALYEAKREVEMVDKRIEMAEELEWEVARAVQVALLCTQAKPQARPSMSKVCTMLRSQSCGAAILQLPLTSRSSEATDDDDARIFSSSVSPQPPNPSLNVPITVLHPR